MSLDLAPPYRSLLDKYDRRRYQRYDLSLGGRYMLESRREFACRTIDISPDSIALRGPVPARIGERVVAYIDHLGRLEGEATRIMQDGFGVTIQATLRKRDKLAQTLAWLAERDAMAAGQDRRHARIVPRNPFTSLTLPDGVHYRCRLIDLSLSGAGIAVAMKPPIGTPVTLGTIAGAVVRHFDEGIGVEFITQQDEEALNEFL